MRRLRSRATDEEVAVHEAAHAVVIMAVGGTVTTATIVPSGGYDGRVECPHDGLLALRYLADGPRVPPSVLRQLAADEIRAHLAGRAGESLLTGEPHFGAAADCAEWWANECADAEWLDDVVERDSDMAGALEAAFIIDHRDVVGRLAREYEWTLSFLEMNWGHIELLADALLELGTICPMQLIARLPELGSPRR